MFQRLAQQAFTSWARASLTSRVALGAASTAAVAASATGASSPGLAALFGITAVATNPASDSASDVASSVSSAAATPSAPSNGDSSTYACFSATEPSLAVPASFKTSLPLEVSDRERQIRSRNGIPDVVLEGDTVLERHAALESNQHRVRFTPWETLFFLQLERLLPDSLRPSALQNAKGMTPFDYQAWFKRDNVTAPRVFFDLALIDAHPDATPQKLGRVTVELSACDTPAAAEAVIAYCEGFTHKHRVLATYNGTYMHAAAKDGSCVRGGDLQRDCGVNSILFRDQRLAAPHSIPTSKPGRGCFYLLETESLVAKTSGSLCEFELKDVAVPTVTSSHAADADGTTASETVSTGKAAGIIGGVVIAASTDKVPVGRIVEGLAHLDTANRWLNSQPEISQSPPAAAIDANANQQSDSAAAAESGFGGQIAQGWARFVKAAEPYVKVTRNVTAFPGYHHRAERKWEDEKRVMVTDCGLVTPFSPVSPAASLDPAAAEAAKKANARLPDPYKECREVIARVPEFELVDREQVAKFDRIVQGLIQEEYVHAVNGTDTWLTKRQRLVRYQKALDAKNDTKSYK